MARWTADDFVQEMNSIQRLVGMRPGTDMEPKLVQALQDRMAHHPGWTADQLCKMMEAVGESSLSGNSKDGLLKALDDAAGPTIAGQSQVRLTSKPQTLVQLCNYLSKSDWAKLSTSSSWDATVVVSERLRRLGLTSLKEETKKYATGIIVTCQIERLGIAPSYDDIYRLAEQLHKVFLSVQVPRKAAGVTVYPLHPSELGPGFMKDAYDPEDPPEPRDLPGLVARVVNETPVRSTSSLLSWNQEKKNKKKGKDAAGDDALHMQALMHRFLQQTVGGTGMNNFNAVQPARNGSLGALQEPCPIASGMQGVQANTSMQSKGTVPSSLAASSSLQALQNIASPQHAAQTSSSPRVPAQQCTRDSMLQTPSSVAPPPVLTQVETAVTTPASSSKLEAIEQEAFKALQAQSKPVENKKRGAPDQGKAVMKRPSAKASAAKPVGKASADPPLKLGCIRCRGCRTGCSQCQDPGFKGLRLTREEWKEWYAKRQLALAKGKACNKKSKSKK
ncbi:unnamed protein product [Symbiodinium sp. CCMP2592]|nr:unnamed protein product [Symbiodinium sp. CCMP2592]